MEYDKKFINSRLFQNYRWYIVVFYRKEKTFLNHIKNTFRRSIAQWALYLNDKLSNTRRNF